MFTNPFAGEQISVVKKASDFMEGPKDAWQFFADWHNEGFWYASTGEHFMDWLTNISIDALNYSEVLVFVGVVLVFLAIAGSNRAKKFLWWDFVLYFVAQATKVAIGM